jgi:hypothetical protein
MPLRSDVDVFSGHAASSCGQHFHVDDVVFCGADAGVCLACVDDLGVLLLLVELLEPAAVLSRHSGSWRQTVRRALWAARSCDVATAWRFERGALVVVRV